MTRIWIDTTTGTWGEVDGGQGRLVIVDATDEQVAALDNASDSEIFDFGTTYGRPAVPAEPAGDTYPQES